MDRILKALHKDTDDKIRLYALIDSSGAVRDDALRDILYSPRIEKTSLFTGELASRHNNVAPYLICLEHQEDIEKQLIVRGWGKNWGIFLTSDADIKILLAHFRIILHRELEDGRMVFFRFYDPIVLADYLPLLASKEAGCFFGPVKRFVFESTNGLPLEFEKPESASMLTIEGYRRLFGSEKTEALEASGRKRLQSTAGKDNKLTFLNRKRQ